MGSKAAGAVLAASLVVGGYAAYRAFKQREGEEQQVQWIYAPVYETGGAKAKLAALDGRGQGGGRTKPAHALAAWGIDTLFGALDGKRADGSFLDGLFGKRDTANDNRAPAQAASFDRPPSFIGQVVGGVQRGTKGVLDFIANFEAPEGYNQVYGGTRLDPPRPITTMTVREVLHWQDRSVAAGSASSAAGRYQIIRGTLREQVRAGAVGLDEKFTPEVQDRIGNSLLEKRGLSDYRAGRISRETFADNLAKEWASLPAQKRDKRGRKATGQSYYAGDGLNRAHTSQQSVLDVLGEMI